MILGAFFIFCKKGENMPNEGNYATYRKVNEVCKELPFMKSACLSHIFEILSADDLLSDGFAEEYDGETDIFGLCKPEGESDLDVHGRKRISSSGYVCNVIRDRKLAKELTLSLRAINAVGRISYAHADRCPKVLDRMADVIDKADPNYRPFIAVHCALIGYYGILSTYTTMSSGSAYGKLYIDDLMTGRINRYIRISRLIEQYAPIQSVFGYDAGYDIDDSRADFDRKRSEKNGYSSYFRIAADMRRIANSMPSADCERFKEEANANSPDALAFFGIDTSEWKASALNARLTDDEKAQMLDRITSAKGIKDLANNVIERKDDSETDSNLAGMIDWIIGSAIVGNPKIKDRRFPETKDSVVIGFIRDAFLRNGKSALPVGSQPFRDLFAKHAYYFYNPYLIIGMARSKDMLLGHRTDACEKTSNLLTVLLHNNRDMVRKLAKRFAAEMRVEYKDRANPWPKPLSNDDMAWDRFGIILANYEVDNRYDRTRLNADLDMLSFDEGGHLIDPAMYVMANAIDDDHLPSYWYGSSTPEFNKLVSDISRDEYDRGITRFGLLDGFLHDPMNSRMIEYEEAYRYRDFFGLSEDERSTLMVYAALSTRETICAKADHDGRLTEADRAGIAEWFTPIEKRRNIALRFQSPQIMSVSANDIKDNATDIMGMLAFIKMIRINSECAMFEFADDQIPALVPKSFRLISYEKDPDSPSAAEYAQSLYAELDDEIANHADIAKGILMDGLGPANLCATLIDAYDRRGKTICYSYRRTQDMLKDYADRLYLPLDGQRGDTFHNMSKFYSDRVFPALEKAGAVTAAEEEEFLGAINTARLSYEAYVSLNP